MVDIMNQDFLNQAQNAQRSIINAMQGYAEIQTSAVQRLASIQQGSLQQAYEAANEQLQLAQQTKDPKVFASAQADLIKRNGQRYTNTVNEAVDVVADAWKAYADKIADDVNRATDKAKRTASKGS